MANCVLLCRCQCERWRECSNGTNDRKAGKVYRFLWEASMTGQKRLSWPPVTECTGQEKGQLSCKHHWTTWKTLRETPKPCFFGRRVVRKQGGTETQAEKHPWPTHSFDSQTKSILFVCVCLFLHVFLSISFLSFCRFEYCLNCVQIWKMSWKTLYPAWNLLYICN